jgi:hypothetical protein
LYNRRKIPAQRHRQTNPKPGAEMPAWQPLSFGGVAAFARASLGRLMAVEASVAALVALCLVWAIARSWVPMVELAISRLPAEGMIEDGRLQWFGPPVQMLAEGRSLAILVNLQTREPAGQVADMQLEFGRSQARVCSILGCLVVPYPSNWIVYLNRSKLEPWWGAWKPAVLIGGAVMTAAGLMLVWGILAAVHAPAVRILAWVFRRQAGWLPCWQLALAAFLPGALVWAAAILLYTLYRLPWAGLLLATCLQIVIAWVYLVFSPMRIAPAPERKRPVRKRNPFQGAN